jgi:hypothetical protein
VRSEFLILAEEFLCIGTLTLISRVDIPRSATGFFAGVARL